MSAFLAGLALSGSLLHPLGNFSVNQLEHLSLYPDRVEVAAVVDLAELPTLQEKSNVDSTYPARNCAQLAGAFEVTVDQHRLLWTVTAAGFSYAQGAAGLQTSRLSCTLTAPADLSKPAELRIANHYRTDRVGWRELTATASGVHVEGAGLPSASATDGLRQYPRDLLSSPLDVRSATLRTVPGGGIAAGSGSTADLRSSRGWLWGAEEKLRSIVGGTHPTPLLGVLAVLLSLLLGAGHAALPGHGKTVMAAYLAGRRGRPRDALAVGATVTLTHTGAVLVLGLILSSTTWLAGEQVLSWLGLASGLLVVAVGGYLVWSARRRGHQHGHHHRHHDHDHHDHDHHDHDHHSHDHHSHDHHDHNHQDHDHHHHDHGRTGRWGLAGMGLAGGLVPSPSALIVLLAAAGLGRTAFGIGLVFAYGIGMAATLTAAGLLLLRLRDRWARRPWNFPRWLRRLGRWAPAAPTATAGLVLVVGLGLAARAAAGLI